MNSSSPQAIRVPTNTHPQYYGAMGSSAESPSRSYQTALESLAGSHSRASIFYVAENIPVPGSDYHDLPSHHGSHTNHLVPEDDSEADMSSKLHAAVSDADLRRTISERTARSAHFLSPLSRHTTVASVLSQQEDCASCPRSTFVQSVFNAVNILIGVGILALPLAFRYTGWIIGSALILFCGLATNYTAKLIARCLDACSDAVTYGDMGAAAFGSRGRTFIGGVFIFELITICIAMIVLLGDGIEALFPSLSLITNRMLCFAILTPTMFFPIRHLAYTSLIGIVSCVCLVIIVLYDGFTKPSRPGSLVDPMDTDWVVSDMTHIPLCIGLIMSGFAGHAVFPAIYRDMDNPKKYNKMVDITYVITAVVYIAMAGAGYLMFGEETMQEITQNLAKTPGYNQVLNRLAVWLIVMTPIAKYGLVINPLKVSWELWLWTLPGLERMSKQGGMGKTTLMTISRILANTALVIFATIFPGFDRVMSLLGSLFSFGISVIFPLICYMRLFGHSQSTSSIFVNWVILAISIALASIGTVSSLLPT